MGRYALLVGTSTYDDRSLENLPGVRHDLDQLKAVLDQAGQFDTADILLDKSRDQLAEGIEAFFQARKPGDLAFFYYSGHGLVADDREKSLFLAATNSTKDSGLHAGAVDTDGLLRHCLNSTRAREKVVLLDCCFSGSFELRSQLQAGGRRQPRRGIRQTGTFMLTATTHVKAAKGQGADRPSMFTGTVLDGLRGRAGVDGAEWITTDDLARYVLAESKTRPMESREGVTEPIGLVLAGSGSADGSRSPKKKVKIHSTAVDAELDSDQWRRLLEYYATCLERSAVIDSFVEVSSTKSYLVFPAGPEQVFAGASNGQTADPAVVRFAKQAESSAQLRYGYPVLMLAGRRNSPTFSPLLVSDVAITPDGRLMAQPPVFNRAIGAELQLSELEIDDLAQQVQETFVPGDPGALDETVRRLLQILSLQAGGVLSAAQTLGSMPRGPVQRVHNTAVLFAADPTAGAQRMLLADLRGMKKLVGEFGSTALAALADGPQPVTDEAEVRIVTPVRLNEGQEQVVRKAMTQRLTVAQGPPGTGKSQLITALVATATSAGQSVLVGSTNNRAVEEVVERIKATVGPGLLIRTGNKEQLSQEPRQLSELLAQYGVSGRPDTATSLGDLRHIDKEVADLRQELDIRRRCETDLAALAERRSGWEPVTFPDPELSRLVTMAHKAGRAGILGWWWRRRLSRSYGIDGVEAVDEFGFRLATEAAWRAGRLEFGGLRDEATVWPKLTQIVAELRTTTARRLLVAETTQRIQQGRTLLENRIRTMSAGMPRSWTGFQPLLRALPAWATTTMSARNLPPRPGLFDLVVIDEAAQCSIPTLLPMLLRAKRVLIIGDPHQLSPVITLPLPEDGQRRTQVGLNPEWLENRSLVYSTNSGYDAFARVAGSVELLDEHYRCHPQIIEPPNRVVYRNQLTVLTDPKLLRVRTDQPVVWKHVPGEFVQGSTGSGRNDPEVAAVVAEVASQLKAHPDASVGVVTPLAAQAGAIERALRREHLLSERVLLGTIHRFQGGERDIMIVSPVGSKGITSRTQRWLAGQTNLWNVAITRARSSLVVVGDRGWWSAQRSLLTELLAMVDPAPSSHHRSSVEPVDALQAAFRRADRDVVRDAVLDGRTYALLVDGKALIQVDDPDGDPDGRRFRKLLAWADVESPGVRVRRVPAWRCLSEPDLVVAETGGDS